MPFLYLVGVCLLLVFVLIYMDLSRFLVVIRGFGWEGFLFGDYSRLSGSGFLVALYIFRVRGCLGERKDLL